MCRKRCQADAPSAAAASYSSSGMPCIPASRITAISGNQRQELMKMTEACALGPVPKKPIGPGVMPSATSR